MRKTVSKNMYKDEGNVATEISIRFINKSDHRGWVIMGYIKSQKNSKDD